MRRAFATLLTGGLVATSFVVPLVVPGAVVTPAAAETVTAAQKPYSSFKISVKHTARTKRGGKITYKLRAKNLGPHYADYYWIGGEMPKGVKPTLRWSGPKGTTCSWKGRWFWCWGRYRLEKGRTDWLNFQVTLKKGTKGTKGTARARVGIISYDVPTGAENVSKEGLERLGIKGFYWLKTARTRIVSPPKRPTRGWTPPPVVKEYNPPTSKEEQNKKKDT